MAIHRTRAAVSRRCGSSRKTNPFLAKLFSIFATGSVLWAGQAAQAETFTVLHAFQVSEGVNPNGVLRDAAGNIYGTNFAGGATNYGTVFELNSAGKLKVLHSFVGFPSTDGAFPVAGVIQDDTGNLYGTTIFGGTSTTWDGTIFKLDTHRKLTVLYSYCSKSDCSDGENPASVLVRDSAGNLYGTAMNGGNSGCMPSGCGVVFRLSPQGKYKVLHAFSGGADGDQPAPGGGLLMDAQGNLYGTAYEGGDLDCQYLTTHGCGTVFKIDPQGNFTVLHTFTGSPDGEAPSPDLTLDASGNLYGTTNAGGAPRKKCFLKGGCGTVFRIDPTGEETVIHSFCSSKSCGEGALPQTGVTIGPDGSLYGTTEFGTYQSDSGTVFRLKGGRLSVLHNFTGGSDGLTPQGTPVLDAMGNLYGATFEGGDLNQCQFGCGVVFEITQADR